MITKKQLLDLGFHEEKGNYTGFYLYSPYPHIQLRGDLKITGLSCWQINSNTLPVKRNYLCETISELLPIMADICFQNGIEQEKQKIRKLSLLD